MAQPIEQTELQTGTVSKISAAWLREFAAALHTSNAAAVARTFLPDGWLRDSLTFTWNNRSLHGRAKITSYLGQTLSFNPISNVAFDKDSYFVPKYHAPQGGTIEFGFRYETPIAWGRGHARLMRTATGRWEALTVGMVITDLKGHEEPADGIDWEVQAKGRSWGQLQAALRTKTEANPTVLIGGSYFS